MVVVSLITVCLMFVMFATSEVLIASKIEVTGARGQLGGKTGNLGYYRTRSPWPIDAVGPVYQPVGNAIGTSGSPIFS